MCKGSFSHNFHVVLIILVNLSPAIVGKKTCLLFANHPKSTILKIVLGQMQDRGENLPVNASKIDGFNTTITTALGIYKASRKVKYM